MVDIDIRPARPTTSDGLEFARLLDVAADELFALMLGGEYERIVAEAFLDPGHDLSHEHVVFAEVGDVIVGMASAYPAEAHAEATDDALESAAGWRRWRVRLVGLLAAGPLDFMDDVPAGDHYLQALAVDESQRGHGIGSALMGRVEELARQAGSQRLILDVAFDNDGARRLYERRGMEVIATSPRALIPSMRVRRMAKRL